MTGVLKQFKYVGKKKWVHFGCSRFYKEIEKSFINGGIVFICKKELDNEVTRLNECCVCKKMRGDFLVKCCYVTCGNYAHSECVLGGKMVKEDKEGKFYFYCGNSGIHDKEGKENGTNDRNDINVEKQLVNNNKMDERNVNETKPITQHKDTMNRNELGYDNKTRIDNDRLSNGNQTNCHIDQCNINNNNYINNSLIKRIINNNKEQEIKKEHTHINTHHHIHHNKSPQYNSVTNNNTQQSQLQLPLSFIITFSNCDICCEPISTSNGNAIRCSFCLTWTHITCTKQYFPRLSLDYPFSCYKCIHSSSSKSKCVICSVSCGTMSPIFNKWIHIVCARSFPNSFFLKQSKSKTALQFCFDNYKHSSKQINKCILCTKSNSFIIKCDLCGIYFHPYCAFQAQFKIKKIAVNEIRFVCNEKHSIYIAYKNNAKIDTNKQVIKTLNTVKNSMLGEIGYEMNVKVLKRKKKLKKLSKNKKKEKNVNDNKGGYENLIKSVDFNELKRCFITTGVINPLQVVKIGSSNLLYGYNSSYLDNCNNNNQKHSNNRLIVDKYNWELTNPYFINIKQTVIDNAFSNISSTLDISEETINKEDKELPINEHSIPTNPLFNPNNSLLCNIKYKSKNYYLFYNVSKLTTYIQKEKKYQNAFSNLLSSLERTTLHGNLTPNTHFLSKKRFLAVSLINDIMINTKSNTKNNNDTNSSQTSTSLYDNSYHNNNILTQQSNQIISVLNMSKKLMFIKGFKLNQLSQKILSLESSVVYPKNCYNSNNCLNCNYINESIQSKYEMLKQITELNNSYVNKIVTNYTQYINQFNGNETIGSMETPSSLLSLSNEAIKSKYRSHTNYQRLCYHLIHSIQNIKTYNDIIPHQQNNTAYSRDTLVSQYKNDSECCVCFDINTNETNDCNTLYTTISSPIIFCDKCNVSFHQSCYGINAIPDGEYICDLCRNNSLKNSQHITCILCCSSFGAFKKMEKNRYLHVTCVLLSNKYYFDDYYMLNNIKELNNGCTDEEEFECVVCKKKEGEITRCECCLKAYHFFCVYFIGGIIDIMKEKSQIKGIYPNDIKLEYKIRKCICCGREGSEERKELKEVRRIIYQKGK